MVVSPARNPGERRIAASDSRLVGTPATRSPSRLVASVAAATSRVGPWAMILASIGS